MTNAKKYQHSLLWRHTMMYHIFFLIKIVVTNLFIIKALRSSHLLYHIKKTRFHQETKVLTTFLLYISYKGFVTSSRVYTRHIKKIIKWAHSIVKICLFCHEVFFIIIKSFESYMNFHFKWGHNKKFAKWDEIYKK